MITFTDDENLEKIRAELGDIETDNNYKIFGLTNNTPKNKKTNKGVEIHYNLLAPPILFVDWEKVSSFLRNNGISSRHLFNETLGDDRYLIKLGLRKDIRQHPKLCACIIKTIILTLEGKIKLRKIEQNTKIQNIPVFTP